MKHNIKVPLLFLAPSLILIIIFLVIPIFASLYISLTDFNIYALIDWSRAKFIGLDNYKNLLHDELFWKALKNTLYFALIGIPLAVILALFFAILLNRPQTHFKKIFRTGFYLPSITNTVAVAVVWAWVLNPQYGVLNWILSFLGIAPIKWLSDPKWAMPSIIMFVVWKGLGYNIIIFLAGLQSIPAHLYESAQIDGANRWQQLCSITIPLLRPTTFFVTIMVIIGYLQLFAEPYMLTQGGPLNATLSIVLYMYRHGFKFFNLGYASAIAYVLFGLIFMATLIQLKFKDKQA